MFLQHRNQIVFNLFVCRAHHGSSVFSFCHAIYEIFKTLQKRSCQVMRFFWKICDRQPFWLLEENLGIISTFYDNRYSHCSANKISPFQLLKEWQTNIWILEDYKTSYFRVYSLVFQYIIDYFKEHWQKCNLAHCLDTYMHFLIQNRMHSTFTHIDVQFRLHGIVLWVWYVRHELTYSTDKCRTKVGLCPFIRAVHFPPAIAKTFCKVLKCSTFLLKVSPSILGQCNTFDNLQGGDKNCLFSLRIENILSFRLRKKRNLWHCFVLNNEAVCLIRDAHPFPSVWSWRFVSLFEILMQNWWNGEKYKNQLC